MMAQTFKAAFDKAAPKIKDNTDELMKEGYARIIFDGKKVMLCVMASSPHEHTPFSIFVFEDEWLTSMHTTDRDGYTMGWHTLIAPTGQRTVLSGDTADFKEQAFYYMKLNYFIKNCETELKVVAPNQKLKTEKEKILNESNRDLIYLDAGWFTTIVRDIPFGVDGHFRWQPFGEGRKKVKLKWIDSYQKEGYSRRAKIEDQK